MNGPTELHGTRHILNHGTAMSNEQSGRGDARVAAVAKALARRNADLCNVNFDDLWALESESFFLDARAALAAADEVATLPDAVGGEAVSNRDDASRLLREVFALCEATEDAPPIEPKNEHQAGFDRGRRFEAKGIRRAIGTWFQDEFCGRSFMGEPVTTHPAAPAVPEGYELDDLDRDLIVKVKEAVEYDDNGDPVRDLMDEDEMIDAMRLLLKVLAAAPQAAAPADKEGGNG